MAGLIDNIDSNGKLARQDLEKTYLEEARSFLEEANPRENFFKLFEDKVNHKIDFDTRDIVEVARRIANVSFYKLDEERFISEVHLYMMAAYVVTLATYDDLALEYPTKKFYKKISKRLLELCQACVFVPVEILLNNKESFVDLSIESGLAMINQYDGWEHSRSYTAREVSEVMRILETIRKWLRQCGESFVDNQMFLEELNECFDFRSTNLDRETWFKIYIEVTKYPLALAISRFCEIIIRHYQYEDISFSYAHKKYNHIVGVCVLHTRGVDLISKGLWSPLFVSRGSMYAYKFLDAETVRIITEFSEVKGIINSFDVKRSQLEQTDNILDLQVFTTADAVKEKYKEGFLTKLKNMIKAGLAAMDEMSKFDLVSAYKEKYNMYSKQSEGIATGVIPDTSKGLPRRVDPQPGRQPVPVPSNSGGLIKNPWESLAGGGANSANSAKVQQRNHQEVINRKEQWLKEQQRTEQLVRNGNQMRDNNDWLDPNKQWDHI